MAYSLRYKPTISSLGFSSLLLWTSVGFVYTLDINTHWGCVDDNSVFSFHNISLSLLSIALLSVGFFYKKQELGKWLIGAEVAFWIYKLFFVKGGYVVGITASMPTGIVLYDLVALTLRLLLVKQLFAGPFKPAFISILALSLIIKVRFFR